MHPAPLRHFRAFTLIELVVVVVIMGVLVAVGAFAYDSVLSSSRDAQESARTEQVARELRGAAALRNVALGDLAVATAPGAGANEVSEDVKARLGVESPELFVTPLAKAGPFPARLQVRSESSYSCVSSGTSAGQTGPCPLLMNAGFEDPIDILQSVGKDHVSGYFASPVVRDTSEKRSGVASARVTLTSTASVAGIYLIPQSGLTVTDGTQMRGGAWVKAPVGVRLRVAGRIVGPTYGYLSEYQGEKQFVGTGEWEYLETKPWSTTGGKVHAGLQVVTSDVGAGRVMWVDDVSLTIR